MEILSEPMMGARIMPYIIMSAVDSSALTLLSSDLQLQVG